MDVISGIYSFGHIESGFLEKMHDLDELCAQIRPKNITNFQENNFYITHNSYKEQQSYFEEGDFLITGIVNNMYLENEKGIERINLNSLAKKLNENNCILESLESKLTGQYCLIIFHKKEKKLCVIRDHFGFIPFYYCLSDKGLIFSTDYKILEDLLISNLTLNLDSLSDYIDLNIPELSSTFFKEINKLEPSHKLNLENNGLFVNKPYKNRTELSNSIISEEEKIIQFKYLLDTSVRKRISNENKTNKLGLLLSGGLDSSVIGLSLRSSFQGEIISYSMNYSGEDLEKRVDESKYQRKIIDKIQSKHFSESMKFSPFQSINQDLSLFGQPYHFPNIHIYRNAYENFKRNGVKVYFDGYDGDTVVSHGYEYLKELAIKLRIFSLFNALKGYSNLREQRTIWFLKFIYNVLKDQFLQKLGYQFSILKNKRKIKWITTFFSSHKERLENPLISLGLEYTYKMDSFFGIRRECPFLDSQLTGFTSSLPSKMKYGKGETRFIMREAYKEELPKIIYERLNKANLGLGLVYFFSLSDLRLIKRERKSIHPTLAKLIDLNSLDIMIEEIDLSKEKIKTDSYMYLLNFCILNSWLKEIVVNKG